MASGGAAARMDPEAATKLVRKGSTLLLLDVPQRTLFGIDTQVCAILPATTLPTPFVRASNNLTGFRLSLLHVVLLKVFSVGPKFRGMKMVLPGPHFIYYCSSCRYQYELLLASKYNPQLLQHVD
jgi:A1 cistron-splicing factor AAR2